MGRSRAHTEAHLQYFSDSLDGILGNEFGLFSTAAAAASEGGCSALLRPETLLPDIKYLADAKNGKGK